MDQNEGPERKKSRLPSMGGGWRVGPAGATLAPVHDHTHQLLARSSPPCSPSSGATHHENHRQLDRHFQHQHQDPRRYRGSHHDIQPPAWKYSGQHSQYRPQIPPQPASPPPPPLLRQPMLPPPAPNSTPSHVPEAMLRSPPSPIYLPPMASSAVASAPKQDAIDDPYGRPSGAGKEMLTTIQRGFPMQGGLPHPHAEPPALARHMSFDGAFRGPSLGAGNNGPGLTPLSPQTTLSGGGKTTVAPSTVPAGEVLPYPQTPRTAQPFDPNSYPVSTSSVHDSIAYSVQFGAATTNTRRRTQRASQACDSCRQLKAKCDEMKPCKACREKGIECKYREAVPKAQDRVSNEILESISQLAKRFADCEHRLATKISAIEDVLVAGRMSTGLRTEQWPGQRSPEPRKTTTTRQHSEPGENQPDQQPCPSRHTQVAHESHERQDDSWVISEDQPYETPGPFVAPFEPQIPPGHTTAAHNLLASPPIYKLIHNHVAREGILDLWDFPVKQERRRGLLRLYGWGEGGDLAELEPPSGAPETPMESLPPSPADCWGQVGGVPSPTGSAGVSNSSMPMGAPAHRISSSGSEVGTGRYYGPDYSPETVWRYVQSFQDNILNMHPIIPSEELVNAVHHFLEYLHPGYDHRHMPRSLSVASTTPTVVTTVPSKRKWSPSPDSRTMPSAAIGGSGPPMLPPTRPCRSIRHALVLMVLALGKLSLHSSKIPDPTTSNDDSQQQYQGSYCGGGSIGGRRVAQSPVQPSPVPATRSYSTQSSNHPSPASASGGMLRQCSLDSDSRRSMRSGGGHSGKRRNCDVIPGLEYFAPATDIMGNQLAGGSLRHIWTSILAGLFHGQLGRFHESWSYIAHASEMLLHILHPKCARLQALKEKHTFPTSKKDNLDLLTYWTCLQLESDILAELASYRASRLLGYEELLPYPSLLALQQDHGIPGDVLSSYFAQLFLRKHLNTLHKKLYDPGRPPTRDQLRELESTLTADRSWMPPTLHFDPRDPPARDILGARLRAKFWGAQVIVYRPFIRYVLEHNYRHHNRSQAYSRGDIKSGICGGINVANGDHDGDHANAYVETVAGDTARHMNAPKSDSSNDTSPRFDTAFRNILDINDPMTVEKAILGLNALRESTRAFWGVGAGSGTRIIITNCFGTTQAQWGNCLTLIAAFQDPMLQHYLDSKELKLLVAKTVRFIDINAASTSPSAISSRLLRAVGKDVLGMVDHEFDSLDEFSFAERHFEGHNREMWT